MTAPQVAVALISRPLTGVAYAVARIAGLLAVAGVLLATLLVFTGHDPVRALGTMWYGAFGTWYQFSSVTLVRAIPLALTGLAVSVAFRAGILNIGAEGQLLAGAAAAAALVAALPAMPGIVMIPLLLAAGAMAGAMWAGIAAWLRKRFGVLEVISTIMLNFIALNVVGYLVRGPLQEPLRIYPQSPTLDASMQLPMIIPGTRLHAGVAIVIVAAVLLHLWLTRYASGFRVRATGANPAAAAAAGRIDVTRVSFSVFVLSGMLAGLAGTVEYTGVTYALYENFSPGYGYTAIAVALLARLEMPAVLLSALLFGALDAGANAMQRDAGVPNVVVNVINALLILLILVTDRAGRRSVSSERGT